MDLFNSIREELSEIERKYDCLNYVLKRLQEIHRIGDEELTPIYREWRIKNPEVEVH